MKYSRYIVKYIIEITNIN